MKSMTGGCALAALLLISGCAQTQHSGNAAAAQQGTSSSKLMAPSPAKGSGLVVVTVDTKTGRVTSSRMAKSTGNKILDDASVKAMLSAKFKPGVGPLIRIPITWTLTNKRLGSAQSDGR